MDLTQKLKNKSIGYYCAFLAALVSCIGLGIYFVYISRGGNKNPLIMVVCMAGVLIDIALFFYNGKFSDLLAIFPAVAFVIALGLSASGGVGNITDDVMGIDCFGIASIAKYNYQMIGLFGVGVVLSILACFIPREK